MGEFCDHEDDDGEMHEVNIMNHLLRGMSRADLASHLNIACLHGQLMWETSLACRTCIPSSCLRYHTMPAQWCKAAGPTTNSTSWGACCHCGSWGGYGSGHAQHRYSIGTLDLDLDLGMLNTDRYLGSGCGSGYVQHRWAPLCTLDLDLDLDVLNTDRQRSLPLSVCRCRCIFPIMMRMIL